AAARRSSRAIDEGGTFSVVIKSPRTPAAAIPPASPSLAQATPSAPAWIWRRAISGHLWVFACGRIALLVRRTCVVIRSRLRWKRSRSSSSEGVGISSRVMTGDTLDSMLDSLHVAAIRTAVPPDPRTDARSGPHRARDGAAHHRPPRASLRSAGARVPRRSQARLPDRPRPRAALSGLRDGSVGSDDRQHALTG